LVCCAVSLFTCAAAAAAAAAAAILFNHSFALRDIKADWEQILKYNISGKRWCQRDEFLHSLSRRRAAVV
jgi:hypothetical protein